MLLTMLNLPAVSASGLDKLTANEARRLFAPAAPVENGVVAVRRPKIILCAVELFAHRNVMPTGSLAAIVQLERIERMLSLDTSESVGIWLPSAREFRQIADAAALSSSALVRETIMQSVAHSETVEAYRKSSTPSPANNFVYYRQKLEKALDQLPTALFGTRDVEAHFAAYRKSYDEAFARPLRDRAAATSDLADKCLLNTKAELVAIEFDASDLVLRARQAIAGGGTVEVDVPLDDRMRRVLRIADGYLRIKKGLENSK